MAAKKPNPDQQPPEAKAFPLEGKTTLSDAQLKAHRDVLYQGYVKRLGEIESSLGTVDRSTANAVSSPYRALKAEETFALNGVVLHELYFGNLGTPGPEMGARTKAALERDFGGVEAWQEDFLACGKAARGWVLFAYSLYDGRLHNYLLDTHHLHVPVLAIPLLVLDVYELAYFIDYGTDRPKYMADFLQHAQWDVVEKRLAWAEDLGPAESRLVR
jgi:Fe-Mn family superoxide dismutase